MALVIGLGAPGKFGVKGYDRRGLEKLFYTAGLLSALKKNPKTFLKNLNIFIRNHTEKIIKRTTTIAAMIGCLMIKYSTPKTALSSATLATELANGTGVELMATRVVALVK